MEKDKNILGPFIIGWSVIVSNFLLMMFYYLLPQAASFVVSAKLLQLIAITAVFPLDFFDVYLRNAWPVHIYWMGMVILSALGLFRFHYLARIVFIVFNILHAVTLVFIVLSKFGQPVFMDYFFRLYFNLVAVGAYVGFLTLPETRAHFGRPPGLQRLLALFDRLRLREPRSGDARGYFELGLAYLRLGRLADAENALHHSVQLNPKSHNAQYRFGMVLNQLDKFNEAIPALEESIRLNPQQEEAYQELGTAYRHQGRTQEAIDCFQELVDLSPAHSGAYRELAGLYLSVDQYAKAIQALVRLVHVNPRDDEAYGQMGKIHLEKMEAFKEARENFLTAIRLNPRVAENHYLLGLTCIKLDRWKDAIRAFKDALRLDDGHKLAHYQLGFAYARIHDHSSARREYQILKQMDQDLANNLDMLIKP